MATKPKGFSSKEEKQNMEKVRKMDDNKKMKVLLDAISLIDNLPKSQRLAVMLGFLAGADLYRVNLAQIGGGPFRKGGSGPDDPPLKEFW